MGKRIYKGPRYTKIILTKVNSVYRNVISTEATCYSGKHM